MNFYRRVFIGLFFVIMVSCTTVNVYRDSRVFPKYSGVDPELASYVNNWLEYGSLYDIKFNHPVSIGLTDINDGATVGLTHWSSPFFREIDIDKKYWSNETQMKRIALLWHELGHAYCNRYHDYGHYKYYKHKESGAADDPSQKDGFFNDKCPISIMFPFVVPAECMVSHWQEYIDETFKNCKKY